VTVRPELAVWYLLETRKLNITLQTGDCQTWTGSLVLFRNQETEHYITNWWLPINENMAVFICCPVSTYLQSFVIPTLFYAQFSMKGISKWPHHPFGRKKDTRDTQLAVIPWGTYIKFVYIYQSSNSWPWASSADKKYNDLNALRFCSKKMGGK